jgi:hypothetical protein
MPSSITFSFPRLPVFVQNEINRQRTFDHLAHRAFKRQTPHSTLYVVTNATFGPILIIETSHDGRTLIFHNSLYLPRPHPESRPQPWTTMRELAQSGVAGLIQQRMTQ